MMEIRDNGKERNRKHSVEIDSNNLEDQLQPGPNIRELYENCLQRHNKFIR